MNSLEEIALKVAKDAFAEIYGPSTTDPDPAMVKWISENARRLVAALGAQQVPIAEVASGVWGDRLMWACSDSQGSVPVGTKLFAAPVLPSVPEPVAYLHYAAKKPSLRELSFSAEPNALQIAAGWKSKPLFAAAPSPQEDAP